MPSIENRYPRPCANCGHKDLHGDVSGCVAMTSPDAWCVCDTYVDPRAAGRAEGQRRAAEGADAALHGHAMTHDPTEWRDRATARLQDLIAGGREFTAEDVTEAVGVAPSPSAIGGLFRAKSFKEAVRLVRIDVANRPVAHGRPLRVWQAKPAEPTQ